MFSLINRSYGAASYFCIANTSPVQSLSLESGIRLPSLLGCGDRPIPRTGAGGKQKHILNSRYSFVLLCSYNQWGCILWHLSVLRCGNQLILKDCCRLSTVAAYELVLRELGHQIANISYQIRLNMKHKKIGSRIFHGPRRTK